MNWGSKIVISFVIFALIMGVMVTISVRQDFFLVSKDYYKEEIAYQDQIDRMANQRSLLNKPTLDFDKKTKVFQVSFPKEYKNESIKGAIHFFRPSDANKDRIIKLQLDGQLRQTLDLSQMEKGLWRVKFKWSFGDHEYFEEKIVVI